MEPCSPSPQPPTTRDSVPDSPRYASNEAQSDAMHDPDSVHELNVGSSLGHEIDPTRLKLRSAGWTANSRKKRLNPTSVERNILSALQQMEAGDLAFHLYNAQAIKQRLRLAEGQLKAATFAEWQRKSLWTGRQGAQSSDEVVQKDPCFRKSWTAWPLDGQAAPGMQEHFRQRGDDGITSQPIGALEGGSVGDELREEILALFSRLARAKWQERALDSPSRGASSGKDLDLHRKSTTPEGSSTSSGSENSSPNPMKPHTPHQSLAMGQTSLNDPLLHPEALTDDAVARRMMQPSIDSLLTLLNHLSDAIRRTRLNHWSGAIAGAKGKVRSDTGLLRPRSESPTATMSTDRRSGSTSSDSSQYNRPKSTPFIRQASNYQREQDNTGNGNCMHTTQAATRHLGLLDWSEVLGLASMTKWNQEAVGRSAQRCASLFDEGMSFRVFQEEKAVKPLYDAVHSSSGAAQLPSQDRAGAHSSKRPSWEKGSSRCPHVDCWGHEKNFEYSTRAIEHVKRTHGYDPRTNDSDNEERKAGGVHIDGFMQTISAKRGWLGKSRLKSEPEKSKTKYRRKRKRSKNE